MKRKLKDIYNINKSWWDSFTSCFIGTLLGIGITFWISGTISKNDKANLEKKIQVLTINSLQRDITSLKRQGASMMNDDSIFQNVMEYYPDRIEEISPETAGQFYSRIMHCELYATSQTAENMFNSNIEIWKSIDNLSTINIIGEVFAIRKKMVETISQLEDIKMQLFNNISHEAYILDFKNHHEAMRCFFNNNENPNLLLKFKMYCYILNAGTALTEKMVSRIKDNLNITDKDLDMVYNENYDIPEDSAKMEIR